MSLPALPLLTAELSCSPGESQGKTWETGEFPGEAAGAAAAPSTAQGGDSLGCRTVLPMEVPLVCCFTAPLWQGMDKVCFYFSAALSFPFRTLPGRVIPTGAATCARHAQEGKTPVPAGRRDGGVRAGQGNVPARSSTAFCCPASRAGTCWGAPHKRYSSRKYPSSEGKDISRIYPGWWDMGDP